MKKTFSKFNNKEENKVNLNSSFIKEVNKSYYENKNNNLRSLSPITHKRNEHIEYHKLMESKFDLKNTNNQDANISYFEEFNVKFLKIKLFFIYIKEKKQ
jgi:hypothetical protein